MSTTPTSTNPYPEAAFWFAMSAIAIAVGYFMAGCSGDVVPSPPAHCKPTPSYTCPRCNVHSCDGGWGTTDGELYACRVNESPGFPNLDCYRAQMEAVVGCGCTNE